MRNQRTVTLISFHGQRDSFLVNLREKNLSGLMSCQGFIFV